MTVLSQVSSVSYATDGVSRGPFTVPFYFLLDSDLVVQSTVGTTVTLALNSAYTVSGAGDPNGGSITTIAALPTGILTITRDPAIIQDASYGEHGRFPAKSHEKALDRRTMVEQALKMRADGLATRMAAVETKADSAISTNTIQESEIAGASLLAHQALAAAGGATRPIAAIELTDYGVHSFNNVNVALQAALSDGAALGLPVHIPAGFWIVTASAVWPTANNNFPGIFGDGRDTVFVLQDFNGPVISAVVQPGVPQTTKMVRNLQVQAQWTTPPAGYNTGTNQWTSATTANVARLLSITGATDGWSYSLFDNLGGYGVHDIVHIDTDTITTGTGQESESGWNVFNNFYGGPGSLGVYPHSYIHWADASSTGNLYTDFSGGAKVAMVYFGGGASAVVGDIVCDGMQVGTGRAIYVDGLAGPYGRNIRVSGQIDAGSIEVIAFASRSANNLKLSGTFGGSAPWSGIDWLELSEVHDLGESHWGAGGPVISSIAAPAAHTDDLWIITLKPKTMVRAEVSIVGRVGGKGDGGSIYVIDMIYDGTNPATVAIKDTTQLVAGGGSPPAGWPVIGANLTANNIIHLQGIYTDTSASDLHTNITARHGAFKVQRGANVPF